MAWRGSVSRSLMYTVRASVFRSSAQSSVPRRLSAPPSVASSRLNPRRLSFNNPRTLGELGCAQSMLLHSMIPGVRLTSHLAVNVRGCCELTHGTFRRTCQDR